MKDFVIISKIVSCMVVLVLLFTVIPSQLTAQESGSQAPEMTHGSTMEFSQGYFKHGIFGDFNDDSVDDFMAIYDEHHYFDNAQGMAHIVLFDGSNGDIIWVKDFTQNSAPQFFKTTIDDDDGDDVIVSMMGFEEVPVANSSYTYNMSINSISRLNGLDGSIVWTFDNIFPLLLEVVTIEGKEMYLTNGYSKYGNIEGGLHLIDLDTGEVEFTGIGFNPSYNDFVIDRLPNGDDMVIVYGDRAIEAYLMDGWSLIWEYDFFDNDVYHTHGFTGLYGQQGTVCFQASKGNITQAIIALDTSDGSEVFVSDINDLDLFMSYVFGSGHFNDDSQTDFLVLGFEGTETVLCPVNGADGSSLWKKTIPINFLDSNASTSRIIDMNADGLDDILLIMDSEIQVLTGIDGSVIFESSLEHRPHDIILARQMGNRQVPNLAYVHDNIIYTHNLHIPGAPDTFPAWILAGSVIIAVAVLASVALYFKRKGNADNLNRENHEPEEPQHR